MHNIIQEHTREAEDTILVNNKEEERIDEKCHYAQGCAMICASMVMASFSLPSQLHCLLCIRRKEKHYPNHESFFPGTERDSFYSVGAQGSSQAVRHSSGQ